MSRAEFESCSPDEVHELWHAWEDRERRKDWRFAALIIAQGAGGKDSPPLTIGQLFPRLEPELPDADELERKFASFEAAHNAAHKVKG